MKFISVFFFSICIFIFNTNVFAQLQGVEFDSTGLKIIKISHADSAIGSKNNKDETYQRLLGAVVIEHDGIKMTCDSAHFFLENNFIETYSNVNITKANGVNAHANYMKYTGNNNTAYMKENVQIIDGKNTLNTEELTYNIKTKIGKYYKGGNIQNEETNVSSEEGSYNGYSEQTYFKKNVYVSNPKYNIESKELMYNIKTKVVKLLDSSTIITENTTIVSKNGTYDSKTGNAVFTSRTRVETEDQTIYGNKLTYNDQTGNAFATGNVIVVDEKNNTKLFADKVDYNKKTGSGKASKNVVIEKDDGKNMLYANEAFYNKLSGYIKMQDHVVIIDTEQKSLLKAGVVQFNENSDFMMATIHPKLISKMDDDSLFMRADTMISMRIRDTKKLQYINVNANKKNEKPLFIYNLLYADSTFKSLPNEDEKKIMINNKHVKMFSDSMQAVCDSLVYNQYDSTFSFYKSPILWSKNQEASADTIIAQTNNNKLKLLHLIQNAFLLSHTGYDTYYDQVSGTYIDAYFDNENEIKKVHVNQNAEAIYYGKDDDEKYLGSNKLECAEMFVYFKDKNIEKIISIEEPKNVATPIDKETDATKFLSTFKLFTEKKPTSKKEILEDEK